jgi:hypothetical protein
MSRHDELFQQYVEELQENKSAAIAWWDDLLVRETARAGGDRDEALKRRERRWPFGPASHPFIIRVYRKYFLLCEELNVRIESERTARVQPRGEDEANWGQDERRPTAVRESAVPGWVLLVDMLWGRHDDLAQFLEGLVFKPVATDPATGEFI